MPPGGHIVAKAQGTKREMVPARAAASTRASSAAWLVKPMALMMVG